jgi:hypothetical protein
VAVDVGVLLGHRAPALGTQGVAVKVDWNVGVLVGVRVGQGAVNAFAKQGVAVGVLVMHTAPGTAQSVAVGVLVTHTFAALTMQGVAVAVGVLLEQGTPLLVRHGVAVAVR